MHTVTSSPAILAAMANSMDGPSFIASPVIVDGTIYRRSRTQLSAICTDADH